MKARTKGIVASIGSVAVLATAGLFGQHAFAATTGTAPTMTAPDSGLASKLASTFHLDQAAVQKVIDQNRQDNQAAMQADRAAAEKTKLDKAVADGSLTAAQETLIIAKQAEMQAAMTPGATRPTKAEMDQKRTDLEAWAKANGIDMKWLAPMGGHGPGMRGMGGNGPASSATPSAN